MLWILPSFSIFNGTLWITKKDSSSKDQIYEAYDIWGHKLNNAKLVRYMFCPFIDDYVEEFPYLKIDHYTKRASVCFPYENAESTHYAISYLGTKIIFYIINEKKVQINVYNLSPVFYDYYRFSKHGKGVTFICFDDYVFMFDHLYKRVFWITLSNSRLHFLNNLGFFHDHSMSFMPLFQNDQFIGGTTLYTSETDQSKSVVKWFSRSEDKDSDFFCYETQISSPLLKSEIVCLFVKTKDAILRGEAYVRVPDSTWYGSAKVILLPFSIAFSNPQKLESIFEIPTIVIDISENVVFLSKFPRNISDILYLPNDTETFYAEGPWRTEICEVSDEALAFVEEV